MQRQRKKLAQVARIQARGQLHIPTRDTPHDEPAGEIDEALAAWGLQQAGEDVAIDDAAEGVIASAARQSTRNNKCYLWPCNVATFNVWQQLQTQWRVGMAGRTGLDYTAVAAYLRDVLAIKPKERADLFKGLQAMEFAALNEWAKNSD